MLKSKIKKDNIQKNNYVLICYMFYLLNDILYKKMNFWYVKSL